MKKIVSVMLIVVMLLGLAIPVLANVSNVYPSGAPMIGSNWIHFRTKGMPSDLITDIRITKVGEVNISDQTSMNNYFNTSGRLYRPNETFNILGNEYLLTHSGSTAYIYKNGVQLDTDNFVTENGIPKYSIMVVESEYGLAMRWLSKNSTWGWMSYGPMEYFYQSSQGYYWGQAGKEVVLHNYNTNWIASDNDVMRVTRYLSYSDIRRTQKPVGGQWTAEQDNISSINSNQIILRKMNVEILGISSTLTQTQNFPPDFIITSNVVNGEVWTNKKDIVLTSNLPNKTITYSITDGMYQVLTETVTMQGTTYTIPKELYIMPDGSQYQLRVSEGTQIDSTKLLVNVNWNLVLPKSTTVKIGDAHLVSGGVINEVQGYDNINIFWTNITNNKGILLKKTHKGIFGLESTVTELNEIVEDHINERSISQYDKSMQYTYTLYVGNPASSTVLTGFGNCDVYKFKYTSEIAPSIQIIGVNNGDVLTSMPRIEVKKKNDTTPYTVSVNSQAVYTFSTKVDESYYIPDHYLKLGENIVNVYDGMLTAKTVTFTLNTVTQTPMPPYEIATPRPPEIPPDDMNYWEWILYYLKQIIHILLAPVRMLYSLFSLLVETLVKLEDEINRGYSAVLAFFGRIFGFLPMPWVFAGTLSIAMFTVIGLWKR